MAAAVDRPTVKTFQWAWPIDPRTARDPLRHRRSIPIGQTRTFWSANCFWGNRPLHRSRILRTEFMDPDSKQYFLDALATPSPSGFEEPIQRLNQRYIESHVDQTRIDIHGNFVAVAGPTENAPKLLLAGHCDQIGMLVSHIDDDGFIYAQTIGGWDPQQLIGQAMTIWPRSVRDQLHRQRDSSGSGGPPSEAANASAPIPAVISRKPIHLLSTKERGRVVDLDELWLDIGAADGSDAKRQVSIGDPVTLDLRHRRAGDSRMTGPGMDNKSGMWTVVEALRRATELGALSCQAHAVATVQEEIGLRGAKTAAGSIHPDVAIAVDVTHASDCPTIEKNRQGDIRLGRGPVIFRGPNINAKVADRLIDICTRRSLPYQTAAIARATPNDANALQIHGGGVAVGLVAIPNRYMHSAVEMIDLEDLDAAATLLAHFARELSSQCDFIPS